ncbi:replication-relaxation family protein [Brevibacillus fulvus]|uniref:Replication-relaxation n=1 Tax=Brevibacillus fulvus TaxID=1125967 RepID=A0A938Y303_9BACL|nr:hypothetical protein [Brevibacillus fulvus]MBM7592228.1 hypothetical protein [Brevibacillus fulvus]
MRLRDKEIIKDLEKFRCLSRNDIIKLHFQGVKDPINSANRVLRRLRDRGEIEVITSQAPYVYACKPSPIKRDSQKIPHYLEIVQVYHDMAQIGTPSTFIPEPKYGKGLPEPDIFTIWGGKPMFIEVQRNTFTSAVWGEKFARYRTYFHRKDWMREPWQGKEPVFPWLIILTQTRIAVPDGLPLKVFQIPGIRHLLHKGASAEKVTSKDTKELMNP